MNFVKDPNDQKQKNPLYQSLLKVKNISQALTEFLLSETKQRATRFHDTRQNVNCSMKCTLFRTCIGEGKTVYTHTHMHTHRQNINIKSAKMLHTGYCCLINACIKVINAKMWSSDFSHVLMC